MRKIIWLGCVLFLVLAALWLRLPQTSRGLPAARHPDSAKTVSVANHLAQVWRTGKLELNPGHYQYPTLYINALALIYLVDTSTDREMIGRILAMLAGLIQIPLVFLLGSRLCDRETGLICSSLSTFGVLFTQQGRFASPDSLQTTLVLLAVIILMARRSGPFWRVVLSGAVGGLAVGTKYTAGVYLLPIVLICGPTLFPELSRTRSTFHTIILWFAALVCGLLISTPALVTHFSQFWNRVLIESKIQGQGWIGEPPLRFGDYLFSKISHPSTVPFVNSLPGMLGWPFVVCTLVALVWLGVKSWRGREVQMMALIASCLIGYVFFSSVSNIQRVRFLLPLGVFAVVLVSVWIREISIFLTERTSPQEAAIKRFIIASLLLTMMLIPNGYGSILYWIQSHNDNDTRLAAARWILTNVPPEAKILNFQNGPALPAGRYKIVPGDFPESVWELRNSNFSLPNFNRLKQEGVEWVIWNSYYTNRFFSKPKDPLEGAYFEAWKSFYRDLNRNAKTSGEMKLSDSLSPTIEIFRLKS